MRARELPCGIVPIRASLNNCRDSIVQPLLMQVMASNEEKKNINYDEALFSFIHPYGY